MSKVKIQGNSSGTGVLTVTAPNTSTDRTITLPDSTGTILDSTSTLDATKLSGALPALDGSSLTGTADATKLPLAGGTMTGALNIQSAENSLAYFKSTDANANIKISDSNSSDINQVGIGAIGNNLTLIAGGDNRLSIDSIGAVTMPNQPIASASWTSDVTAGSVIPADSIRVNTGSHLSAAGRFTAPVAGTYWYSYTGMKANSTGNEKVKLTKNGSDFGSTLATYSDSPTYSRSTSFGYLTLAANDYLEFTVATSHALLHQEYGTINFALVA